MHANATQYRLVQSIPLIPVGIAFIGSFFLSDTPRWLASKGRGDEALAVLAHLRRSEKNNHLLSEEYEEIQESIRVRQQNLAGVSIWIIIKEIATISSYRERFLLGIFMMTVAQWSGGNGITYYIPQVRFEFVAPLSSLMFTDIHLCRSSWSQSIFDNLWGLRHCEVSLHFGIHVGSN